MTGRDNELWQQSWRDQNTDFHQEVVNQHLVRFWSGLGLAAGERVFVPLCGKSLDMLWLAQQGHAVIGVELSPLAAHAFFHENGMQATQRRLGAFTLWEHGRIAILCGDFFQLKAGDLGEIGAVFDRAALTALPDDLRAAYLKHLRGIVPATCRILLLTAEEPEAWETADQPFAVAEEITTLYADAYEIRLDHVESIFEADPDPEIREQVRIEHKVYLLTPKVL